MKKGWIALGFMLLSLSPCFAKNIQTYTPGQWRSLLSLYSSRPAVIHFWGVSCAPCRAELAKWGKFTSEKKDKATFVFLETDEASLNEVTKIITDAHLAGMDQWIIQAPIDEEVRYEIDPKWQGETPYTLLISKNGHIDRISGVMDFKRLTVWIKNQR